MKKRKDVYAKAGSTVSLECIADGYPKPVIKWSRLGEMSAVLFSSHFEITSVGREDRGTYKCHAENITPINNIRQTDEAFVTLTIDFPPTITCDTNIMYQVPDIHADAEVTCMVEGYPLSNVRWYFSQIDFNIETEISSDQYHKVDNIASPDSIKSMLIVRNVRREHFGLYTIKVEGANQNLVQRTIRLDMMMNPDGSFPFNSSTKLTHCPFIIILMIFIKKLII
jgi:hypothetical protein